MDLACSSVIDVSKFSERQLKVKTLERQFLEIDTTREIIHDNKGNMKTLVKLL